MKNNKNNIEKEKKATWLDKFAAYETFILVGLLMAAMTLLKLLGYIDFSSDWLWFLAGVGLVVEGAISLAKQRRFDKKYKIIERRE
jgi:hypothetical protein